MASILTITFNPCIDKSTTVDAIAPEKKIKCSTPTFEPGGGGINVARAIRQLGGKSTAIYPAGGYSGIFLQALLEKEGIESLVVKTGRHTRENLIVLDLSINQQYRFGMPGQELTQTEWQQCLNLIKETDTDFIVASGSLPPGVPTDIFARIAQIAKLKNSKLIVDTTGEALNLVLDADVFMIKPNLGELCKLVGKVELGLTEMESVALDLIRKKHCTAITVSLGAAGAMMITEKEVYKVSAPVVKRKSTVGAGDSMVAGIVYSLSNNKSLRESLYYGVACGTAATLNPGTQLCKLEDVNKLYKELLSLQVS
jgi:6-phosphofructokinase 2